MQFMNLGKSVLQLNWDNYWSKKWKIARQDLFKNLREKVVKQKWKISDRINLRYQWYDISSAKIKWVSLQRLSAVKLFPWIAHSIK
jgi:hypothetical protein